MDTETNNDTPNARVAVLLDGVSAVIHEAQMDLLEADAAVALTLEMYDRSGLHADLEADFEWNTHEFARFLGALAHNYLDSGKNEALLDKFADRIGGYSPPDGFDDVDAGAPDDDEDVDIPDSKDRKHKPEAYDHLSALRILLESDPVPPAAHVKWQELSAALSEYDDVRTFKAGYDPMSFLGTLSTDDEDALDAIIEATEENFLSLASPLGVERVIPPREWLVRDWIPANVVTLLAGQGEVGKSRLSLQLGAAVASNDPLGRAWLKPDNTAAGQEVINVSRAFAGQNAVIATWEDDRDHLDRMLEAGLYGGDVADLYPRFWGLQLLGKGPTWGPENGDNRRVATQTKLCGTLKTFCERHGAKLLIIDTLAAAFSGNENDRTQVRPFMSHWAEWAEKARCSVLIIAHPPKSGADFSGSTDWHGAARAMLTLGADKCPKEEQDDDFNGPAEAFGDNMRDDIEKRGKSKAKEDKREGMRLQVKKSNYGLKPKPVWVRGWPRWTISDFESSAADFKLAGKKTDFQGNFKP